MKKEDCKRIFHVIGQKLKTRKNVILYGVNQDMVDTYSRIRFFELDLICCDWDLRGNILEGVGRIYSLEEIFPLLRSKQYLLVLSSGYKDEMAVRKRLMLEGFIENEDYFMGNLFKKFYLPMWALHAHDKCYMEYVGQPVASNCTLRCKHCSASIPYLEVNNPSIEEIMKEMDLFFQKVDICYTYDVTSGETFIASDKLVEILEYLIANYSGRFGEILITTNATVVPSKKMLKFLLAHKDIIKINVSQYPTVNGWTEKYEKFKMILTEWKIPFIPIPVRAWIDFGFKDTTHNMSEEELIKWFDLCQNFCRLYTEGKLYYCAHGHNANLAFYKGVCDMDECLDFRNANLLALDIIEYNLGCFDKGYLSICAHCKGHLSRNKSFIPVAEQIDKCEEGI